jgi:hypothetical protein
MAPQSPRRVVSVQTMSPVFAFMQKKVPDPRLGEAMP